MEKQIKLFLEFLVDDKKLSQNTLQSYRRDILQFKEYLDENGKDYLEVEERDINSFFDYLREFIRLDKVPLIFLSLSKKLYKKF